MKRRKGFDYPPDPPVPDGYKSGLRFREYGLTFHLRICQRCGAWVGDTDLHDTWHEPSPLL